MHYIRKFLLFFVLVGFAFQSLADEGMWIPMLLKQLNESDMQANGLKLTAEDIYSINKSSMKDGVVHFGGGCTSEIISPKGLLLTNHHCGYSRIQSHSSVENDYLTDGFWAMKQEDELPNQGLTATLIVRMEDVTNKVLVGVTGKMTEEERQKKIRDNMKTITESVTVNTHYEATIRPFYHGNEYYLFVTEVFKDVRLVGAPPSSIGKFGFDTDNWVWPRHTGDFSLFRIYADKDNKPAEYSKDNVPYQPKHYFPISMSGVEEGDFTMVYGFPGRTFEYLPSFAVDQIINKKNPARIKMRKHSLSVIDEAMASSDKIRIQYAAKQSRISNAYKKWIGQNKGLFRIDAVEMKKKQETEFLLRTHKNPQWKKKYGTLLTDYEKQYAELEKYTLSRDYFIEVLTSGPEILRYANSYHRLVDLFEDEDKDPTQEEIDKAVAKMKSNAKSYFKNYDVATDQKLFEELMTTYYKDIDQSVYPEIFHFIKSQYGGDFEAYGKTVYDKTFMTDQEAVMKFLDGFKASSIKKLQKDPAFDLATDLYAAYRTKVLPKYREINDEISKLDRTYMEALQEVLPKDNYYPDANSTLRVSYGKVEGYLPRDGVKYSYYTTLRGIAEKADPDNKEFNVPAKLLDLYETKDYGPYGDANGEMRVCFIASNHTTGGNSGSPVFDGSGNLIGLNFDRSWESTMSDIVYDRSICRNIMVDIRYVLFIVDKFAGAKHLVDEMSLVTAEDKKEGPTPE